MKAQVMVAVVVETVMGCDNGDAAVAYQGKEERARKE